MSDPRPGVPLVRTHCPACGEPVLRAYLFDGRSELVSDWLITLSSTPPLGWPDERVEVLVFPGGDRLVWLYSNPDGTVAGREAHRRICRNR